MSSFFVPGLNLSFSPSSSPLIMPRSPKAAQLAHSISDSGLVFPCPGPSALAKGKFPATNMNQVLNQLGTVQEREDFMYQLLSSMPRSQLSALQRRIAPLLQFDVVSSLPTEVALQIFSHLPPHSLLVSSLVSKRWNVLANDQSLWKALCHAQGWEWRHPNPIPDDSVDAANHGESHTGAGNFGGRAQLDDLDEGMGDSDDDQPMMEDLDSGFVSGSPAKGLSPPSSGSSSSIWAGGLRNVACIQSLQQRSRSSRDRRHSTACSNLPLSPSTSRSPSYSAKPKYKQLYRIHTRLRNRFLTSSYRLSVIQTRGSPANGHNNMIYCVQLYTYPITNQQVIFTSSRDKTIKEWDLRTGEVERVFEGVHTESVLSLCVRNGWMASAGSDWRVVLWNLNRRIWEEASSESDASANAVVNVLKDHGDSVLCVRFDEKRLVSCSKDRTVRVYSFPDLELLHILSGHWAAVNAISLCENIVVSGSGDRCMNVWDVETGKLLRTFSDHHTRGIASIDFKPPYIVSGSSDQHIRLIDMHTSQGWSTSEDYDTPAPIGLGLGLTPLGPNHAPFLPRHLYSQYLYAAGDMCHSCGSTPAYPPFGGFNSTSISGSGSTSTSASAYTSGIPGPPIPLAYSQSLLMPHPSPHHRDLRHSSLPQRISSAVTSIFTSSTSSQTTPPVPPPPTARHTDLVRSVSLGPDFVITASYDLSVKIWDRTTGVLVGDLTGGHTGKIFCVAADRTKVISCGEDMRICVWDFAAGVEGVEGIRSGW